jgi:hypothetical protein
MLFKVMAILCCVAKNSFRGTVSLFILLPIYHLYVLLEGREIKKNEEMSVRVWLKTTATGTYHVKSDIIVARTFYA